MSIQKAALNVNACVYAVQGEYVLYRPGPNTYLVLFILYEYIEIDFRW